MITKRFGTTEEDIRQAGRIIAGGGLIAFPTETVYGLGADALNAGAVASVYEAKGRPSDNPMIVHIASAADLERLAYLPGQDEGSPAEVQGTAGTPAAAGTAAAAQDDAAADHPAPAGELARLMEAFWPGPLTFVMRKRPQVPDRTTGGLDTVAVRMPDNETARRLIEAAGCPIAAPSANISGRPSPTRAEDVLRDMDGRIDGVICGEDCRVGIESTVLDLTGETPTVLRPGMITAEQLEEALGRPVEYDRALFQRMDDADYKPKSPGMKYRHYAPKADMIILAGEQESIEREMARITAQKTAQGVRTGTILFGETDFEEAAHALFARLRELDREGVDLIIAGALDAEDERGFAVMNRMMKSAGYHIIEV